MIKRLAKTDFGHLVAAGMNEATLRTVKNIRKAGALPTIAAAIELLATATFAAQTRPERHISPDFQSGAKVFTETVSAAPKDGGIVFQTPERVVRAYISPPKDQPKVG